MQAFIALFLTNLLGPEQLQIMYKYYRKKAQKHKFLGFSLKAPTRFELVIEVLQTFALPLGYGAIFNSELTLNDSDGNRTRVTAVKGRCLNRLTMEPKKKKTPRVGLEPTTTRLTAECSTIELSRIIKGIYLQNFIQTSDFVLSLD